MKKYLVIVILIIVLTMLIFMITGDDSALPLNHDGVRSIEYCVYPQDTPVFSVFDDSRIEEITNAINQLDTSEESNRSEIDKLSDNYYQLYFNMNDGDDISIEVDSDTI